jgi:CHAD domain-containing protein
MPATSKWIDDITYEMSVPEAARRSLQSRLAAVQRYFGLAVKHPERDAEYIHQLRVFTRRTTAALKLYADVLPAEQAKWFRRRLSKVRRAAGKARDLDVLARDQAKASDKAGKRFRKLIRRERKKAQRPIKKLYRRLVRGGSLSRHVDALLEGIVRDASELEEVRFGDWARSRLDHIVEKFFAAAPSEPSDLKSLHRFRIRGKELRYAMELLASAFPPEFRNELYPIVQELQDMLGEINDHAVACARFERWIATSKKMQRRYLKGRLEHEHTQLAASVRKLTKHWTPDFAAQMRENFRIILNSEPPAILHIDTAER